MRYVLALVAAACVFTIGFRVGRLEVKSRDGDLVQYYEGEVRKKMLFAHAVSRAHWVVCGRFLVPFASDQQANAYAETVERVASTRRRNPEWRAACDEADKEVRRQLEMR